MSGAGDGNLREMPPTWGDRWLARVVEIAATGAVVVAALGFIAEGAVLAHNTVYTFEMFAGTDVESVSHGKSIIDMGLWAGWGGLIYWWQHRRGVSE